MQQAAPLCGAAEAAGAVPDQADPQSAVPQPAAPPPDPAKPKAGEEAARRRGTVKWFSPAKG